MTLPLAERFMRGLLARLSLVAPQNGYHTSAGENVARHRTQWQDEELPALALFDGGTTAAAGTADGSRDSMDLVKTIQVVGYALANQDTTGEVLAYLDADIKRNVLSWVTSGAMKLELEKQIGSLAYVSTEPLAREEGKNVEGVIVTFNAAYREGYGEPNTRL